MKGTRSSQFKELWDVKQMVPEILVQENKVQTFSSWFNIGIDLLFTVICKNTL